MLAFCYAAKRTAKEIAEHLGILPSSYFRKEVLDPLVKNGYLFCDNARRGATYLTNREKVFLE